LTGRPIRLAATTLAVLAALVLFASGNAEAAPKTPVVSDIRGKIRAGEAHIAFNLKNAFSPEMVEALKSGIEISFKTEIRIEIVRHGWFNDTIGEADIVRTVRFDALSRVYRLSRGGREEHIDDVLGALAGMTSYEVNIPVSAEPEHGRSYRVRIRTKLDRVGLTEPLRSIIFFSSFWDVETPWARGYLAVQ
jgi:hypothetical protein